MAERRTRNNKRETLRGNYADIIGESSRNVAVLKLLDRIADTKVPVLIYGERGTGKELVVRALHQNSSRCQAELVVVNCAGIPDTLLESQLFGYEKGAFTDAKERHIGKFERAHQSTLFLDEIGELPPLLQPKLLRALQEGEIERLGGMGVISVDVRVVVATNRNLPQAVKEGIFRADLYDRLNVVPITMPLLQERKDDIPELARHFLNKHREELGRQVRCIDSQALLLLCDYAWPGNIRELENAIIRAMLFADEGVILPEHLPEHVRGPQLQQARVSAEIQPTQPEKVHSTVTIQPPQGQPVITLPLCLTLKQIEREFILKTLAWKEGNLTRTARTLGMSLSSLRNKLKIYGKR